MVGPRFTLAVSYASPDRDYVEAVVNALKGRGVSVFYAELPIQPDFVGLKLPHADKHVQVKFMETDGEDKIIVKE